MGTPWEMSNPCNNDVAYECAMVCLTVVLWPCKQLRGRRHTSGGGRVTIGLQGGGGGVQ